MTEQRWDLIAVERRALADLIDSLSPEQLATQSLCGAWTVKEIAAHVIVGPTAKAPELLRAAVLGFPSLDRINQKIVDGRSHRPIAELTAMIRDNAESRFSPPTLDWHAPLSDTMLHREDIAVPLGIPSDRPVESWRHVLDFVISPLSRRGFVRRGRPEVRAVATDVNWAGGSGPEVSGPAAALAMALCGRPAGVVRLEGPGVESLARWVG